MPDLASNREKQSEEDQQLNSDKTPATPISPTHVQIEPQPSTSGCQLVQEVALVNIFFFIKLKRLLTHKDKILWENLWETYGTLFYGFFFQVFFL